jgi:hypothetical protein
MGDIAPSEVPDPKWTDVGNLRRLNNQSEIQFKCSPEIIGLFHVIFIRDQYLIGSQVFATTSAFLLVSQRLSCIHCTRWFGMSSHKLFGVQCRGIHTHIRWRLTTAVSVSRSSAFRLIQVDFLEGLTISTNNLCVTRDDRVD